MKLDKSTFEKFLEYDEYESESHERFDVLYFLVEKKFRQFDDHCGDGYMIVSLLGVHYRIDFAFVKEECRDRFVYSQKRMYQCKSVEKIIKTTEWVEVGE